MASEIFVATRNLDVFEVLSQRGLPYQAGLFTDEIIAALESVRVVIIDESDVVPLKYNVAAIKGMLAQQHIASCSSEQFLQDPDEYLRELDSPREKGPAIPPKRTIGFTSYSGGTGKTTLALDTAIRFAQATKRNLQSPALVVEFSYGASAISVLTGVKLPPLFDLVTEPEDHEMAAFQGVTLVGMDYDSARDLSVDMLGGFLDQQIARHTLTVLDVHWPHGLVPSIERLIDRWVVLATPRLDAVDNAEKLCQELGAKAALAINQDSGLANRLALSKVDAALRLPRISHADSFAGNKLGEAVLRWLYGDRAWSRRYSHSRRGLRALFGR